MPKQLKPGQVWYAPISDELFYIHQGYKALYLADKHEFINVIYTNMDALIYIGEL